MQHQKNQSLNTAKSDDLDVILNNLLQGIICINTDGIITTYNSAAEKILDKKADVVLNSKFSEHFDDFFFGFSIKNALNQNTNAPFKFSNPYINIQTVSQNLAKDVEIKSFFGKAELIITIHDITEIKKTDKLAHASNRLKDLGGMTAMLAHEIRNPLGGIKGFASLLQRDLENEPNLKQMVNFIIDGTDHLNRLVTHILNFAHPLDMKFIPTNLTQIVNELKKIVDVDPKFNFKNQKVTFTIDSKKDVIIDADSELIRSMLLNLIINSIQAMPNGGTLSVSLEKTDTDTLIKVKDSGIGISTENLKKIFSAFFTTKKDGNGFGLLEVYKVVQAHKGSIVVDSILNEGTTFTIKIPTGTHNAD
jgi:signal transduction histidine kinase